SYEATFGNLQGEKLDVNVTGNLTVHGVGGVEIPNGNLDIQGNNITSSTTGNVSVGDSLKVYGNVWALGADLAEKYRVDGEVEKGEIVSISEEKDNAVERTTERYQDAVGITSRNPGFVLNSGAEGVKVALEGKVKVEVNTENGEIERGDRIVPSSEPGVGMACEVWDPMQRNETGIRKVVSHNEKCRSATVGRALESTDQNTEILVKIG
ncbi:MAG: hypothetical protein SV186_05290, partial [Candidatus Nanohaloarchaea archaeon]|nr:hypothetical protein [Candidatus Nanohaloarchaea archaeon]